jgi:hypothetical protein
MSKQERQPKLSDYQLGSKGLIDAIVEFPGVESLQINIAELSDRTWWGKRIEAPPFRYTDRFPACLDCSAPACYRADFSLTRS